MKTLATVAVEYTLSAYDVDGGSSETDNSMLFYHLFTREGHFHASDRGPCILSLLM